MMFGLLKPYNFILASLSAVLTWYCVKYELIYDMGVIASVFFVGIFFCFGIIMNTADERRFQVYDEIALINGNLLTIWDMVLIQNLSKKEMVRLQSELIKIQPLISNFLRVLWDKNCEKGLHEVDISMRGIMDVSETLRKAGLPSPEISRIHQFMAQNYAGFERLLSIKEHRTPKVLRSFLQISLVLSMFILAPEFANLGNFGVFLSGFVSLLLASLIEIQNKIEYPFQDDVDDVKFEFLSRFEKRFEF